MSAAASGNKIPGRWWTVVQPLGADLGAGWAGDDAPMTAPKPRIDCDTVSDGSRARRQQVTGSRSLPRCSWGNTSRDPDTLAREKPTKGGSDEDPYPATIIPAAAHPGQVTSTCNGSFPYGKGGGGIEGGSAALKLTRLVLIMIH